MISRFGSSRKDQAGGGVRGGVRSSALVARLALSILAAATGGTLVAGCDHGSPPGAKGDRPPSVSPRGAEATVGARGAAGPDRAGGPGAASVRSGADPEPGADRERRVRFEVLARAAEEAGVILDAGDREILQQAKVERLITDLIEPRLTRQAIPEAEVRAFYDRVRKRFVHGRLVRIAVLCIFTGARMKPEPRARAALHAQALGAYVRAHPTLSDDAFAGLAKDPAWAEQRVGLSTATVWQDEAEPFPAVVGRAALALSHRGETTALVGDETGYYVARYLDERPPENVSFAAARPTLVAEMWEPWRRQRFLALSRELAASHEIEAFPENFQAMVDPDPAGGSGGTQSQ